MQGLTFISKPHSKKFYYDPLTNTRSWKPFNIDPEKLEYIFGNWEKKYSEKYNAQPYYYNSENKLSQWAIPKRIIVPSPDPGKIPTSTKPFPFDVFSQIKEGDDGLVKAQIFYDILPGIYPEFGSTLTEELLDEKIIQANEDEQDDHLVRVDQYIIDNNLQNGDIIYYGTRYETRPEYGFGIVKRDDNPDKTQFVGTEIFYSFGIVEDGETYQENAIKLILNECIRKNIQTTTNYEVAISQILLWADSGIFQDEMFVM